MEMNGINNVGQLIDTLHRWRMNYENDWKMIDIDCLFIVLMYY